MGKKSKKVGKPQRFCSGCQKAEGPNGVRFNQCPRCSEEGFLPALFCCQKCFKKAWPEHKRWHEEEAEEAKADYVRLLDKQKTRHELLLEKKDSYLNLLFETDLCDMKRAKKIVQQAQKLNPARPEAYKYLFVCFVVSGQMAEAMSCLLESMHRWTLMAMTGFCGEQKMDRTDVFPALIDWTSGVSLVFNYCAEQKHNLLVAKPNWWYQDGMLKRISKVALNAATDIYSLAEHPETAHLFPGHEFSLAQVKATRAKVLSGYYGHALHVIRTEKEIDEAVELFMKPTIHAHGCYGTCPDLLEQMAASHVKMMTDEQTNRSALERGEAGLWVVVHGLVSQAGQAMNGKLGLVFKDGLVNGRVAVEVEGFEGEKRLLPTDLQEIPFSEMQVALISTLPIAEQWKFVRGSNKQL